MEEKEKEGTPCGFHTAGFPLPTTLSGNWRNKDPEQLLILTIQPPNYDEARTMTGRKKYEV